MNNVLFITGASSDIGVALIKSITEECTIIAHYNSNDKSLLELQKHTKNRIIPIQADFSFNQSLLQMLDVVETKVGIPTKIIHLASPKFENIRFKNLDWIQLQNELSLCLGSIIQILKRFLPKMSAGGRVITMLSSVTIGVPPIALAQYTTVKYSLLGLMKALASEYASKNITFNSLSPSMVETQFLSNIDERIVELTAKSHPLKRNAVVSDIVPVILMLLSNDSSYLNGLNIPITGGNNF